MLATENTHRTIRVKTRVFQAMNNGVCLSPKEVCWDPTNLLQQRKQKKTKNKDAPRTTHCA